MKGLARASALIAVLALAGAAALAQPEAGVLVFDVTPGANDGKAVYRLVVPADVPVDGSWSVTVDARSVASDTARKSEDGSVTIQFGDCGELIPNCLPIASGWSYTVRLVRPRPEVLDGRWTFPAAIQRADHSGRGLRG